MRIPNQELVVKIKACKGTINKTTEKSAIESDQISRFVVFLRHFPVFKRTHKVKPFPIIPFFEDYFFFASGLVRVKVNSVGKVTN